ncbi:hypothetical protein [Micromonospora zhanjiangensis]|uniref:WXG100 family type VII secretion target n=1 Tax=Micromonospora zhanjiangensis TaxID=1522057 RepID=A0ABV8KM68_9ACTN
MGTYLDIDGDPNEVAGTGAVLQGLAETFKAKVTAVQGKIHGVEGERPWGNDKFGHGFETTYNMKPEGSDEKLVDSVSEGMSKAGDGLAKLGGNVVRGMNQYQGEDHAGGTDIKQVQV